MRGLKVPSSMLVCTIVGQVTMEGEPFMDKQYIQCAVGESYVSIVFLTTS